MSKMMEWLRGEAPRPSDDVLPDGEDGQDTSMSVRMVEPIRLDTTAEQHLALLQAQGVTGRDKAKIIRAAISLALPTLVSNPHMIDLLQPGVCVDHNMLGDAISTARPSPADSGNGRTR
jgi:hypothetical protein